jgi:hypothetical protein
MFGRKKDHPRAKRPRKSTADQHRIGSNVPTDRKLRADLTVSFTIELCPHVHACEMLQPPRKNMGMSGQTGSERQT